MEYDLDVVHWTGAKQQAADTLLQLITNLTADSDINDDIPVMVVPTLAQKRRSSGISDTSGKTYIEISQSLYSTLHKFMSA